MIASVHLVDGGVGATVSALRRTPRPDDVAGLRDARTLVAAPLGGSPPRPQLGRRAVVALWDGEDALDGFLATNPFAASLAGGFHLRLEPVRAVPVADGPWPGLPPDLPSARVVDAGGPAVVLTIGQLRLARTVPFLRASARAERDVLRAPGLLWATGLANIGQRVVATLSLWESVPPMRHYTTSTTGHSQAMREQAARSFHHRGAFVRFRPRRATGSLAGRNPLPAAITARLDGAPSGAGPHPE